MEITNEFWLDPSEDSGQEPVKEGEKLRIQVNKYERSQKNRLMALAFHGYDCSVCSLNFCEEIRRDRKRFYSHSPHSSYKQIKTKLSVKHRKRFDTCVPKLSRHVA